MKRIGTIERDMLGTMLRCCTNGLRKMLDDEPESASSAFVKDLASNVLAFKYSDDMPAEGELPDVVDTEDFVDWAINAPGAKIFQNAFNVYEELQMHSR